MDSNMFLANEFTQTFLEYLACGIAIQEWTETTDSENKHVSTFYISVPKTSSKSIAGEELAIAFKDLMKFIFKTHKLSEESIYIQKYGLPDKFKVKYKIRDENWNETLYNKRKTFLTLLEEVGTFMPEYREKGYDPRKRLFF